MFVLVGLVGLVWYVGFVRGLRVWDGWDNCAFAEQLLVLRAVIRSWVLGHPPGKIFLPAG